MNEITNTTVNPIAVGDIFEMSWGYDQTNVNYFQVTRLSKSGCFVREIGAKTVPGSEGFMSSRLVPDKDNFLSRSQWCGRKTRNNWQNSPADNNPETFRKLNADSTGQPSFNFEGRYFASRIAEGESTYCSWYA